MVCTVNAGYNGVGHAASMYNNVALQGKAAGHFGADFSIQNESEFPALGSVDGSRGGDDQSQDNQGQAGQKVSTSGPLCAGFVPCRMDNVALHCTMRIDLAQAKLC